MKESHGARAGTAQADHTGPCDGLWICVFSLQPQGSVRFKVGKQYDPVCALTYTPILDELQRTGHGTCHGGGFCLAGCSKTADMMEGRNT